MRHLQAPLQALVAAGNRMPYSICLLVCWSGYLTVPQWSASYAGDRYARFMPPSGCHKTRKSCWKSRMVC